MARPTREPARVTEALAFVRRHGIVLASAKGNAPRLIEAILRESISGNWWAHPRGRFIYNVLSAVCDSEDVLVCRLLGGKVTLVHRRLWPALVRIADRFDARQLAQVRDEHLPSGRHVRNEVPFPLWVPASVHAQAARLSEEEALAALEAASLEGCRAIDIRFRSAPIGNLRSDARRR